MTVKEELQAELGLSNNMMDWLSDHEKGPYKGTLTQKMFDEVLRLRAVLGEHRRRFGDVLIEAVREVDKEKREA